jgi:hypothetical protein
MDRIVLTITSELFDDNVHQEASVRRNITVRSLIEEIRREFSLLEGNYTLVVKGASKPLSPDQTMEQLGIQTGSELIFDRERRRLSQPMIRHGDQLYQPITSGVRAALREESTGTIFSLEWHPAVIGRVDTNNPSGASALAANLSDLAEARTVSRQHARISEQGGQYFLEALAPRNPTFLNDRELVSGERRVLQQGDKIRVGKISLVFSLQRKGP